MASEKKLNSFLKHKRLIIIGLITIGLFIMILLTYILTYASNKPKAFKDDTLDEHTTVVKKDSYFTFKCTVTEMNLKSTSSYLKIRGEISNITQTISDVSVKYEIHNNWTNKGSYTSDSDHKINSGETISPTKSDFYTDTKITLNTKYPITVLPLVKVNHPIIYAKVSYSRKLPDSTKGKGGFVEEVCYYKITYSNYVTSSTTVIS